MNSYWCCIDSPHPNPYPLLASSSIAYIDTRSERSTIISPLSIMEKLYKRDNNERGEVVGDDWGGPQRPTQGCLIEEISHTVWSQKEIRPRIGNPSQDVIIKITNNNTNLVDNSYFSSYSSSLPINSHYSQFHHRLIPIPPPTLPHWCLKLYEAPQPLTSPSPLAPSSPNIKQQGSRIG